MLVAQGLSKTFSKTSVFKNLTFSLGFGEVIQVIGGNGRGKTTLLKCLAGYLNCEYEKLTFNSSPLENNHCAFVSADDRSFFPKLTLKENFQFFQKFNGKNMNPQDWIELLELSSHWEKPYQDCSTGIRKRMAFLRGVSKQRPILLLDEPFANLDPEFQNKLVAKLFDTDFLNDKMIFLTSNNPIYHKSIKTFNVGEYR